MINGLKVTDATVRIPPNPDDKLKAFATIVLNDAFVVSDIKIIQGHQGLFVAMPSRRRKDGKFRDVAHPLNAQVREMIEAILLKRYQEEIVNPTPMSSHEEMELTG
jgi:stage V sporulation protein G